MILNSRKKGILKKLIPNRLREKINSREFLLKMMPKHSVCAEIGVHEGEFPSKNVFLFQIN